MQSALRSWRKISMKKTAALKVSSQPQRQDQQDDSSKRLADCLSALKEQKKDMIDCDQKKLQWRQSWKKEMKKK